MERIDGAVSWRRYPAGAWQPGLLFVAGMAAFVLLGHARFSAADDKEPAKAPAKPSPEALRMLRNQSANKMKQLCLAMHNYHAVHGSLPPAAILDKDGKPLLSWRVMLLPFLEAPKLYDEFHLDEPWDSAHNKKLLERMPKVFDVQMDGRKPGETPYVGFTGKDTIFDGKKGIPFTEIPDGTSNTIMFVESARPVPWSKPEDLPYADDKPLPKLRQLGTGFNVGFCDGSVRFISTSVPEKTLRVLITRNDGVVPGKF